MIGAERAVTHDVTAEVTSVTGSASRNPDADTKF